MSSLTLSTIAFAFIFGGTLLGMALRAYLPEHHLSSESKDAVKLGIGMIATLAALVLGLLTASAKGTFDTMNNEVGHISAKIMQLDAVLADYGPETKEARVLLRNSVTYALHQFWPEETVAVAKVTGQPGTALNELRSELLRLSPRNDAQRWLQSRALQVYGDIADTRWLLIEQTGQSSLPKPFVVTLVFWLTLIFTSFGLFSPRNITVVMVLLVCVLSVAASLFLIAELDQPYEGFIKISSAPLQKALSVMGR